MTTNVLGYAAKSAKEDLLLRRKSVADSLIGGIKETQELLDFRGQHGITSDVEAIAMQDINAAYERMLTVPPRPRP